MANEYGEVVSREQRDHDEQNRQERDDPDLEGPGRRVEEDDGSDGRYVFWRLDAGGCKDIAVATKKSQTIAALSRIPTRNGSERHSAAETDRQAEVSADAD